MLTKMDRDEVILELDGHEVMSIYAELVRR
jgi:hypothetical protein